MFQASFITRGVLTTKSRSYAGTMLVSLALSQLAPCLIQETQPPGYSLRVPWLPYI